MHLIIMGAPGSGKGTCALDLKKIYDIPHISTGDMFRKAIKEQTELGKLADSYISQGKLVPDEVTNRLVKERLQEDDCKKGFLFDGYPRTINQAKEFNKILKELNIELDAAINLEIEDEEIIKRLINRRMCSKCNTGYNILTNKPKIDGICDKCGGTLYTRDDDNETTVRSRLAVYEEQTKPLVKYYEDQNKIVHVNSNQAIDDVVKSIVSALEEKC